MVSEEREARGCRRSPNGSCRAEDSGELADLGKGNSFDDIGQLSLMSEWTAQSAFHIFCKRFAEDLFHEWIKLPTGVALAVTMKAYDAVGFTGEVGSTDVTRHPHRMGLHPGITHPSLHRQGRIPDSRTRGDGRPLGRVLEMTKGMAGVVNDKSIVRSDKTVQAVRDGELYRLMAYKLRDKDGVEQVEKGLYLIVDGEYH